MLRPARPDFLIVGAPKAGTTALHAALAQHPEVFVSQPKEPKYWLCDDAPPPAWRGPGDAHSQQEWIWRARRLLPALRRGAGPTRCAARARRSTSGAAAPTAGSPRHLPDVTAGRGGARPDRPRLQQLDAPVVRRPRAGGGLRDGVRAARTSGSRAGWAPFWRYRELGLYGEQLAHLHRYVDPRAGAGAPLPRRSSTTRARRSTGRAGSSASREGHGRRRSRATTRAASSQPGWRPAAARAGRARRRAARPVRAAAGVAHGPARRWSASCSGRGDAHRPPLTPEQRAAAARRASPTTSRCSAQLTGQDFGDWLSTESRGSFAQRSGASPRSATAVDSSA